MGYLAGSTSIFLQMASRTASARAKVTLIATLLSMTKSATFAFSAMGSWAFTRALISSTVAPSRFDARSICMASGRVTTTKGRSPLALPVSTSKAAS